MAMITSTSITEVAEKGNVGGFAIRAMNLGSPGVPVRLPHIQVPDGFKLVVRAKRENRLRKVYLASSKADCGNSSRRIELVGGETVSFFLTNANLVWVSAERTGLGIEILAESEVEGTTTSSTTSTTSTTL